MFETWLSDPSKVGATGLLLAAIWALLRGVVITAGTHAAALKTCDERLSETVKMYENRIAELTKDRDDYKAMVRIALETTKRTLDATGAPKKDAS